MTGKQITEEELFLIIKRLRDETDRKGIRQRQKAYLETMRKDHPGMDKKDSD